MISQNNKKTLAICESKRQVECLISKPDISSDIQHWIAGSSSAAWALTQSEIPFTTIDDYQSNKNIHEKNSLQSEQIQWATKVDNFINEQITETDQINFRPARFFLFSIKNHWDTYIHRADILEKIVNEDFFDNVIFFRNEKPVKFFSNPSLIGSALSECIPLWAKNHDITTTPLAALPQDTFWNFQIHMKSNPWKKIGKVPGFIASQLSEKSLLVQNKLWRAKTPVRLNPSESKKNIIVREKYDLTPDIIGILKNEGINCIPFNAAISISRKYNNPSTELISKLEKKWDVITDYDWFWHPGGWQDWSIKELIKPIFFNFWFDIVPSLWNSMNASIKMVQSLNPKAICTPLISGSEEIGLIMAAHQEEVPVIFYQHGASVGDIENTYWDLFDGYYSDYLLVYGIGEERYLNSRSLFSNINTKPIPVGSTRLDSILHKRNETNASKIRRKILGKENKPLVLYVTGTNLVNHFRYDGIDFRHCKMFNVRKDIARLFSNRKDVHFVYKAFLSSGEDPTLEMLNIVCPDCTIVYDIPLTELQWAADLIIHELPSTGMYEGLVTDKPMIVYVDRDVFSMGEAVKKLLNERVIVSETNTDFVNDIARYMDKGDFSPFASPNRDFLKLYCTHFDDGNSKIRAASEILSIINKDGN